MDPPLKQTCRREFCQLHLHYTDKCVASINPANPSLTLNFVPSTVASLRRNCDKHAILHTHHVLLLITFHPSFSFIVIPSLSFTQAAFSYVSPWFSPAYTSPFFFPFFFSLFVRATVVTSMIEAVCVCPGATFAVSACVSLPTALFRTYITSATPHPFRVLYSPLRVAQLASEAARLGKCSHDASFYVKQDVAYGWFTFACFKFWFNNSAAWPISEHAYTGAITTSRMQIKYLTPLCYCILSTIVVTLPLSVFAM